MSGPAEPKPFLSRWSQRKAAAREGLVLPPADAEPAAAAAPIAIAAAPPSTAAPTLPAAAPAETVPPPPTLADAALLDPGADVSRFVAQGVTPEVKNAALKKLFADPHYNVMDGLDIYIGDYNTPDPLPAAMLRKMWQSDMLGLFDEKPEPGPAPTEPGPTPIAHEDLDLRLQPDDAAGPAGPAAGAGEDPTGQP